MDYKPRFDLIMTSNEERKPLLNGGEDTTPSAPPISSTIDNPPPYMEEPTVPQLCEFLNSYILYSNLYFKCLFLSNQTWDQLHF